MFRIGQSTDIHRFKQGKGFYLGGIWIPSKYETVAHSDGDCLLHAITESIIGALGLGDLGTLFPDNDPLYKNISSKFLLDEVLKLMKKKHYRIVNIDTLILLEEPSLKVFKDKIKSNIALMLNTEDSCVNIKATTGEKIGIIGESKAIAAQAVVLLKKGDKL
jgi:2-C-methyl-D-erythritol 2,4-cyclodiphosphate synthase